MKKNRAFGFAVITVTYILAVITAVIVFNSFDYSVYINVLLADIAATLVVYITTLIFKNASIYDPYWSVQPMVILFALTIWTHNFNLEIFLLILAICFWGVRLTINWAITFKDLTIQDWRYENFKQRFPRLFPLISLFGIQMFPTIVVYLAMLPAIAIIENATFSPLSLIGFAVCLAATLIQLFSDRQMQQFRRNRTDNDQLIRTGIWKYSRHPNYLGEIMMWWGIYLMMLPVVPDMWFLGAGALVNTIMFFTISIPMAEKRNSTKPGYSEYKRETRALLPIRNKRK